MAHASKSPAPPRPASTAKARGPQPATPSVPSPAPASATGNALRVTLWLLALAVVTGAAPLALAGQAFGYWHIPFTVSAPFSSSLTYDQPLASAQAMVTSAQVPVLTKPANGASVTTLEAGFPVSVTQYATQGSARWARIHWQGPTKTTGGSGWVLAKRLKTSTSHGAQPTADFAALSPSVAHAVDAAGPGFAAWVSFPTAGGYTYRSADAAHVDVLGEQIIPVVLAADYGLGLAAQQPSTMPQNLASGDPTALTFIFLSINKNHSLSAYLTSNHISGFTIASDPTSSTASMQDLGQFYSALTQEPMLSPADQREVFALLTGANTGATKYASNALIGSGALYVTATHTSKGYTTIVAGQLRPANGPVIALAAISADQPTAAKSQAALQSFFAALLADE